MISYYGISRYTTHDGCKFLNVRAGPVVWSYVVLISSMQTINSNFCPRLLSFSSLRLALFRSTCPSWSRCIPRPQQTRRTFCTFLPVKGAGGSEGRDEARRRRKRGRFSKLRISTSGTRLAVILGSSRKFEARSSLSRTFVAPYFKNPHEWKPRTKRATILSLSPFFALFFSSGSLTADILRFVGEVIRFLFRIINAMKIGAAR